MPYAASNHTFTSYLTGSWACKQSFTKVVMSIHSEWSAWNFLRCMHLHETAFQSLPKQPLLKTVLENCSCGSVLKNNTYRESTYVVCSKWNSSEVYPSELNSDTTKDCNNVLADQNLVTYLRLTISYFQLGRRQLQVERANLLKYSNYCSRLFHSMRNPYDRRTKKKSSSLPFHIL